MSAATETFPISTDLSINFSLASSWGLHNRNIKSSVPGNIGETVCAWKVEKELRAETEQLRFICFMSSDYRKRGVLATVSH